MPLSGKGTGSPNLRFGTVGDDSNSMIPRCDSLEPNRHRRDNEPVDVEDVHREAAGLLGISVKSHRQGRYPNRASPLRSQTCPINLYPQSDRSLEPLHGSGSDVHAAAKGKGRMQEGGWQRHCILGSAYNDIVHMDVEHWRSEPTEIRLRAAELGR